MTLRGWAWVVAWGPPLCWAGLIFWTSSHPAPPEAQRFPSGIDKVIHMAVYGALSALLVRAIRRTAPDWRAGRIAAAAILISSLYGALDEFHQLFVPTRTADPLDLLADMAGAAVVSLVLVFR